jgi:type II secretory ATPase GspE/PulE/Tfp pilus assembly ATPase PilB-like protein
VPTSLTTDRTDRFAARVSALDPSAEAYAVAFVEALLEEARMAAASDVHIQPDGNGDGFEVLWRLNGVLEPVGTFSRAKVQVVSRLKVTAELLTYKSDVPQEGRIRRADNDVEMRLSTFPTIHGEKAVVRLFVASGDYRTLDQLGLPDDIESRLKLVLEETSGVLLVAGPAGSGKTTTLYACLRYLQTASPHRRSIASLEDPVEALIAGVAQSQIKASAGFTYAAGLRSMLRQDPEVIMVGEIRDRETAETVFQASLTGHLVLSSFHAGTSADAISRLSDMGIEPYILRSGLRAILTQRLARRLCKACLRSGEQGVRDSDETCLGCPGCHHTGYCGRLLMAELVLPESMNLREAILCRKDAAEINRLLESSGVILIRERCRLAVQSGLTSATEIHRVLGAG